MEEEHRIAAGVVVGVAMVLEIPKDRHHREEVAEDHLVDHPDLRTDYQHRHMDRHHCLQVALENQTVVD